MKFITQTSQPPATSTFSGTNSQTLPIYINLLVCETDLQTRGEEWLKN